MSVYDAGFVHLHMHSAYSLLEGALPIAKLAELAKADKMPALALTDTFNLFGALEYSEKMAGIGIQPILGASLPIDFADREVSSAVRATVAAHPCVVLLAMSEEGFGNLMALSSAVYQAAAHQGVACVGLDVLKLRSQGLILLSGGPQGPVDAELTQGRDELAARRFLQLKAIFGDRFYTELQRHGVEGEKATEGGLLKLAYAHGVPLVATNDCYFAAASDYEAHDALLAIAEGTQVSNSARRQLTVEHRFKTRAEMMTLFEDLPESLENTIEISQRCVYRPRTRKPILPRFTTDEVSAGVEDPEAVELKRQAHAGLDLRLNVHGFAPGLSEQDYRDRLDFELNVIINMKFPGYFLIVADFIQWAKAQFIPVGPGRGSGAGSLVAWALTITDLDPLRFGLLFERFLNPERVSMPDFDIDFCQDRREEVIHYVRHKYGEDRVAQIITFGSLQARGVMRDVGRVLEMPYGQVDRLCKLVPQNPTNPVTLARAVAEEPKLKAASDDEPIVKRMLDIALKLEGLYRHASTHAAGIVIGDRPLVELVPLYCDPRSDMLVTQYNMKWVEQAGLVKFDFLGLKTLTTLTKAVALMGKRGLHMDLSALPLDDAKSYQLLARGETVGVFQVESGGMRRALVDMQPDRFEDIVALVALYRPGPMANIPTYCSRKHGREKPEYPHPKIETILGETFGVIIYQEQVMQIAQVLAGYSLGEADLLRRAMGKKIKAEMDAQRERFVSGAVENGVQRDQADSIFDLLAKFADYGFNKSHAAAYAFISYQTAYLKANAPVEFLAASMTLDMGNTDKLAEFRRDASRLGVKVDPPCINHSGVEFDVHGQTIRYALGAVKGVGTQAAEAIVAARGDEPFKDFSDLARRIDPRLVNKRTLEGLAQAGAFDAVEPNRARAFAAMETVIAMAGHAQSIAVQGQSELFGGSAAQPLRIPEFENWLPEEKLSREYDVIGFFLSGHPLDAYAPILEKMRVPKWSEFAASVRAGATTAGKLAATVLVRQEKRTKSGTKMGIVRLSDASGHYEAIIFSEGLELYRDALEVNSSVLITLEASVDGDDVRARIQSVQSLEAAAARQGHSVSIVLDNVLPLDAIARKLEQGGENEVNIILMLDGEREVIMRLPGKYRVSPAVVGALSVINSVREVVQY
jgi:DNA polymerase-3 subunit alpha